MSLRVCVVGAGPAGLCAAKHSLEIGLEVTVFEQSGDIGGTWRYTDCTDRDEHGAPVHTSMYRDLTTNLPKDVMEFPGYKYKKTERSYISSEDVFEYVKNYVSENKLKSVCQFHRQVTKVRRENDEWLVTVVEFPSNKEATYSFDVVFICNGTNNKPFLPEMEGSKLFEGLSMHSHAFRTPEPFSGQTVLLIGGGPSALDISDHISRSASKVLLSHHSTLISMGSLQLSDNVKMRPDVKQFLKKSVEFVDGTIENIDAVVYCTGFRCYYPFLDGSCGLTEDDDFVFPLYKNIINANHPTMCILGIMRPVPHFPTYDFQVRFFLKSLLKNILPDKDTMIKEVESEVKRVQEKGGQKKNIFVVPYSEDLQYYDQIASMAGIESLPKVIWKMYSRAGVESRSNFPQMRQDNYTVLDSETFAVASG